MDHTQHTTRNKWIQYLHVIINDHVDMVHTIIWIRVRALVRT